MKQGNKIFMGIAVGLWSLALVLGVSSVMITGLKEENDNRGKSETASTVGQIELESSVEREGTRRQIVIRHDYPFYKNAEELTNAASLVFEGQVLNWSYEMIDVMLDDGEQVIGHKTPQQLDPYTVYSIRITKVYKGDIKENETIKLMLMGGEFEDVVYISSEQEVSLELDGSYLFLLGQDAGFPAYLLNPEQSVFNLQHPEPLAGGISIEDVLNQILRRE